MFTPCSLCLPLLFFIVIKASSVSFGREHRQSSCIATSHIDFAAIHIALGRGKGGGRAGGFGGVETLFMGFEDNFLSFTSRVYF